MSQQRYVVLIFVTTAILAGMVGQSAVASGLLQFGRPDAQLLGGLVSTSGLAGLLTGVITLFALLRNQKASRFTGEVVGQLLKVVWPSREEAMKATRTVIFTTLFVAALLGLYDFFWSRVAQAFFFSLG